MDDAYKMIAGRELWGMPDQVQGLLVEAICLIVDDDRHRSETLPALVAQAEPDPGKAERGFISNAIGCMDGAVV